MKNKFLVTTICVLLNSSLLFAQAAHPSAKGAAASGPSQGGVKPPGYEGCDASTPTMMADGSITQDSISSGDQIQNFYQVYVKAGHSYAVEVWNPFGEDKSHERGHGYLDLKDASCLNFLHPADAGHVYPNLETNFNARISWIESSDGLRHVLVGNPDDRQGINYNYNIRIVDTTLFNPRWTTYGGYSTSWGFNNTSDTDLTGTLTLNVSAGPCSSPVSTSVTVVAGKATFLTTADLRIPAGCAGSAVFAFVGPPGAIQADAYMVSSNGTVIPTKFEPRNVQP